MTINNYVLENPNKSAYIIKVNRKTYLGNILEVTRLFGNREIRKIGYEKDFDGTKCLALPKLFLA